MKLLIILLLCFSIQAENLKGFMLQSLSPETVERDVADLNLIGVTLVRYPLYLPYNDIAVYKESINNLARKYPKLIIVADIHWIGCNDEMIPGNKQIILNQQCKDKFNLMWNFLAREIKSLNVWFDLINEPGGIDLVSRNKWFDTLQDTALRIIKINPNRTIVQPINGSSCWLPRGFKKIRGVRNLVLTCHAYPKNYLALKSKLDPVLKFARDNDYKSFYIGEIGSPFYNPETRKLFYDFNLYAKKNDIDYSFHAFREAPIWNYENDNSLWNIIRSFFK